MKKELSNLKTQFLIQQLKYDNFQYSNKAGKCLASQLQHKTEKSIIPSVINSNGKITQDPQEINETFQTLYNNLNFSSHEPLPSETESFLNDLDLSALLEELADTLDAPITPEELSKALNQMPNNKSPRPDGLPAEYFKHLWHTLSPLFHRQ